MRSFLLNDSKLEAAACAPITDGPKEAVVVDIGFKLLLLWTTGRLADLLDCGLSTFKMRECCELRGVTGGGIFFEGAPLGGVSDVRGATGGGGILVVIFVAVVTESERLWILRFLANLENFFILSKYRKRRCFLFWLLLNTWSIINQFKKNKESIQF